MTSLNRAQRFVLIAYCLLVVGCCVWVPWEVYGMDTVVQYGSCWFWAGPHGLGSDGIVPGHPNFAAIGLHLLAVTALAGAAFLFAAKWK